LECVYEEVSWSNVFDGLDALSKTSLNSLDYVHKTVLFISVQTRGFSHNNVYAICSKCFIHVGRFGVYM